MKALAAGLALALFGAGAAAQETQVSADELTARFEAKMEHEEVIAEIGAMFARDMFRRDTLIEGFQAPMSEATRQAYIDGTRAAVDGIEETNTARLKEILETLPYEQLHALNPRAASWATSIISHSSDLAFQEQMLPAFERMARDGRMGAQSFANLYDDVAMNNGRLQRYGANTRCVAGEHGPQPVDEPERLDERRVELGLQPMDAYLALIRQMYGPCPAE